MSYTDHPNSSFVSGWTEVNVEPDLTQAGLEYMPKA
ncbi:hypothetical protein ACCAA_560047 [Candidatus Accumulibacter aalborgensis]|uniref:Uncharacterized protein n=1 Tax=Candidatus Accumulibacter aalborgensis TaxID=1860102 RepID=A0A1A8XTF2_9PROT|nr:hypothetical protein ACCAA_560047 [Candidatus Accumulibacter aalborgensis]